MKVIDRITTADAAYIKAASEIVIAKGKEVNKELVIRTQGQTVLYYVRHNGQATQWSQFHKAIRDYNSRS